MKKPFAFLVAATLVFALLWILLGTWRATRLFQTEGRVGTLTIEKKYNHSYWSSPIPLKRLHAYTARLAPNYEVLIETDQYLEEGQDYPVRFLDRRFGEQARTLSPRPLPGAMRLRVERDGTPVSIPTTDLSDRLIRRAMGPTKNAHQSAAPVSAEQAPPRALPTVPFLFGAPDTSFPVLLWRNSALSEWAALALWILLIQSAFIWAWKTPWVGTSVRSQRKDFVHPSLRVKAATQSTASAKIAFKPTPPDPDFLAAKSQPDPVADDTAPTLSLPKRPSSPAPDSTTPPAPPPPPSPPPPPAPAEPPPPSSPNPEPPTLKFTRKKTPPPETC